MRISVRCDIKPRGNNRQLFAKGNNSTRQWAISGLTKSRFAKKWFHLLYLPQPWPQEVTPANIGVSPSPRGHTSGPPLSPDPTQFDHEVVLTIWVTDTFIKWDYLSTSLCPPHQHTACPLSSGTHTCCTHATEDILDRKPIWTFQFVWGEI